MSVLMGLICNSCKKEFECWVDRDDKGFPIYSKLICSFCGTKHSVTKNWNAQKINPIIPPAEDGQINRFEYSYTNEDGKKINKKIDSHDVRKHFEINNKKGR